VRGRHLTSVRRCRWALERSTGALRVSLSLDSGGEVSSRNTDHSQEILMRHARPNENDTDEDDEKGRKWCETRFLFRLMGKNRANALLKEVGGTGKKHVRQESRKTHGGALAASIVRRWPGLSLTIGERGAAQREGRGGAYNWECFPWR